MVSFKLLLTHGENINNCQIKGSVSQLIIKYKLKNEV